MSLQEIYKKINTITPKVELSQVEIELASIDKFKSDYAKIKNNNPTIYKEQLTAVRKNVLAGINSVGDFQDRIKLILSGLRDLGLLDEAKVFEQFKMGIDEDFNELVSINSVIKQF
jgi:hypothetical protein